MMADGTQTRNSDIFSIFLGFSLARIQGRHYTCCCVRCHWLHTSSDATTLHALVVAAVSAKAQRSWRQATWQHCVFKIVKSCYSHRNDRMSDFVETQHNGVTQAL